jgi:protein PhnA
MSKSTQCPKCHSDYVYQQSKLFICPECGYEWPISQEENSETSTTGDTLVTDAFGTPLQDGDTVTIIKELKVKGASQPLKIGTKVKNIRLVDGDHDINCQIKGFGAMQLKSQYVKKAK